MYYLLLLIIAIPAFISLLNPWYFSMHDFQHIARLYLLDQAVHQGQLYPRWVDLLGFNFGYPLFNFYPPLIYYIAEIFRFFGASYIWSIKLMVMTGYVFGAVGMYLLIKKLTNSRISSLTGAILYTFFTYHAVLVYVRGALAEFIAMSILPFVFLALELLREEATVARAMFFAVMFALLILAHPLIAFPSLIFMGLFILYSILTIQNKMQYVLHVGMGGIFGFGLSAFFWLPSLVERKYTLVDTILTKELASYAIHFVYPFQFWFSQWGYGGSGAGLTDGMSFQLGKIHIGLAVLSVVLLIILIFRRKLEKEQVLRSTFYALLLLFSLFMATSYSKPLWDKMQFLWYLQFPWRFLTFAGVFISVLGGYVVFFLRNWIPDRVGNDKKNFIIAGIATVVALVTIFQYQKYFQPGEYIMKTDKELTSFEEIAWRVSRSSFEFAPKGVPLTKSQYGTSVFSIKNDELRMTNYESKGKADVRQVKNNFAEKSFVVNADEPTLFRLNTFNFPGWTVYLDNLKTSIDDNNTYKLITVVVPKGQHRLRFAFEDTEIRNVANLISAISLLVMPLLIFLDLRLRRFGESLR